ncbi:TPA: hypothetical protein ACN36B_004535 [Vibrio parahaemolyticus]|uniref:hypothetical protein n=1 Tax=Vibrio parahaemolyticus TaxID=670 RepID=UPI001120572B|nr:hypothetical protein [Vibrio parahaemolyticus]EKA7394217.1 hypothetical protein [Vibrio parahaemolyticus]ELA7338359.1 hypothetical protein [Vibrio parahaemolyticus]ELB2064095.1 hypothetical protein [Vibrio parahaemolyticus]MBE4214480.1 hypothetical protein [Vibrio parahaemolyticus]MBE4227532.1 hypothetical protein [Vibrio parahaemolyticus]
MEHFTNRLREPLNETTRKARRNLLAASVLGIVTAKVGLVPTKVSAFGVEFSSSNIEALMTLLALSITYFLVTFIVYIVSELQGWQLLIASKELSELKEQKISTSRTVFTTQESKIEAEFQDRMFTVYSRTKPVFYSRLFVEVFIPLVIAIYSIVATSRLDVTVLFTS